VYVIAQPNHCSASASTIAKTFSLTDANLQKYNKEM
jgi:hypothetical protein